MCLYHAWATAGKQTAVLDALPSTVAIHLNG